jgi:hypothetical protein
MAAMRITIGVMGSAGGLLDKEASSKLETLGRATITDQRIRTGNNSRREEDHE